MNLRSLWPFRRDRMFRVIGLSEDRRNKDQLGRWRAIEQELSDRELENYWRARVKANVLARIARKVAA